MKLDDIPAEAWRRAVGLELAMHERHKRISKKPRDRLDATIRYHAVVWVQDTASRIPAVMTEPRTPPTQEKGE